MIRPWARRILLLLAVLTAVPAACPAPPAAAHATLLFTAPAPDSAVPASPDAIQLVFDQPVAAAGSAVRVEDVDGKAWAVGQATTGENGQTVTARVLHRLPTGAYLVRWEVTAEDGDVMIGKYQFAVGSAAGLSLGSATTETAGAMATTVFRWLLFVGLALSLGGVVGAQLVRRTADEADVQVTAPYPAAWLTSGAVMGAVAATGTALLIAGGGSVIDGLGRLSLSDLAASTPGRIAGVEVLAFAAAAALFLGRQRLTGAAALLVVPVAEGLRAHPQAAQSGVGAIVTAVHLVAAAIWLGALLHVVRVGRLWRRHGAPSAALVASYARLALWLFLTVVLTGAVAVLLLIPLDELLPTLTDTPYGRWLLAKLAAVGAVTALALWARRHLRRRAGRPQPSRAATAEVGVLGVVLGVSGLLTALTPPAPANPSLPFPPPPVGPVVAVGDRAGYIGVGVTASHDQLLVRLSLPDSSAGEAPTNNHEFELSANVSSPGGAAAREVGFRACGDGCFVAPLRWPRGLNTVTLRAAAEGWAGGTTAVRVAWPPRPTPARLKAAVAAMRKVRRFTLHEQVTSDTTEGMGALRKLVMSGPEFLDSEPYGSGVASSVTVLSDGEGETTMALAYPAEGTYVLLTVGRDDRIIRESLASGTHLISRSFTYPAPKPNHDHREHDHP